jgi:HSP20 family molecular chaperone IbpA
MTNIQKFPFGSIDRAWDAFFDPGTFPAYSNKTRGLSYEIKPGEDAVVAEVEVPGCDPSDVKVNCEGRAIHVTTPRGNAYFTVGARIDMDHIEASIRHGLLTLRVPKREARKVEIKVVDKEE